MPDYGDSGDAILSERTRSLRLKIGLSQAELGARMEPPMSQRWVGSIERGERGTNPDRLRELARVLGTTVAYLVGESDDARSPEYRIREHGIDYSVIEKLSESKRRLFADFLDTVMEDADRDARAEHAQQFERGDESEGARGSLPG